MSGATTPASAQEDHAMAEKAREQIVGRVYSKSLLDEVAKLASQNQK